MNKRQITLPADDLDLFLLLMNKNRNNLCEENMEELDLNGGVKTDAIGKRKSLVKEIDRIYSHILMTFKVVETSQREITLPMDDLDLILDTVKEKRESLCRKNIKEMVSNGGVDSSSTRERDELVDDIDRICKHILMTYV